METAEKKHTRLGDFMVRFRKPLVWLARIVIGAIFLISGLSKLIDPWGFIYKMDQYLAVWGFTFPRTITLVGSIAIAGTEFVTGAMMLFGNYRRASMWILTGAMVVMLPLTFYIMVKNPVSDCGCFGDFWIISNEATFYKNVFISVVLIYLWRNNLKIGGLFHPASQWLVGVLLWAYSIIVGFIGYNFQPMIDFRSHPVGTQYSVGKSDAQKDEVDEELDDMEFIYKRNDEYRTFNADNLPDESDGWVFVERQSKNETKALKKIHLDEVMTVYNEDDVDVTDDVFHGSGDQVVLLIPDLRRVDISYTFLINEMYKRAKEKDVDFFAIIATDKKGLEGWRDISMAKYPCYTADDTDIKELARGNIAVLLIENGRITGKRNISSLDEALAGTEI
ncbi:MAG: DoxX family protein [Muribaculaceae bacterium]|nr:DoxX family protein [Muribaculaceae bacterium]